jgi:Protein of unknown function (DUF3300)
MRKALVVSLVLSSLALAPALQAQVVPQDELFSPDELDNLLAPVALYPDPLLAQVLVAATFPDQIDDAARFVRADSDPSDVDGQPWDVSVQAVAHYPTVLQMMDDNLDWTTSLGQAYVNQAVDVMASVQRLRARAQAAGNLASSPQMEVVSSGGDIEIWPAQPQYLYVPAYDPAVVYFQRSGLYFGVGFVIGAWLNNDFDWGRHRIFYHGWNEGGGWVARSRPYIHRSPVYVNNDRRTVVINRDVVKRRVDYPVLDRYSNVHRETKFKAPGGGNPMVTAPPINNKIIRRNIQTNDPRLNEYRGHLPQSGHVETPGRTAFTPSPGGFTAVEASKRGQTSRAVPVRPPAAKVRGVKERK